jgi:hypothetical protein
MAALLLRHKTNRGIDWGCASVITTDAAPDHTERNLDMAEVSIPLPDANGYWYFTYVTTDPETGQWYGGKRSTKKHPLSDRYVGSGNWIRKHPVRDRLRREIIAFYATSVEVYVAEAEMVTWIVINGDPLCMNKCEGGLGISTEYALARYDNPDYRAKNLANLRRMHADPIVQANQAAATLLAKADPKWKEAHAAGTRRIAADPTWQVNQKAGSRRRSDSPEWKEAQLAGTRRRSADPTWQEAVAAANQLKAADPKWLEANATGCRRRSANPTWIENNAAALQRTNAARRVKNALLNTHHMGPLLLGWEDAVAASVTNGAAGAAEGAGEPKTNSEDA